MRALLVSLLVVLAVVLVAGDPAARPSEAAPATPPPQATGARGAAPAGHSPTLLGDMNGDGFVDIRDYGIWRQNFGQTNCGNPADLDGTCIVDIRDYGIWRQNFGQTGPVTGAVVLAGGAGTVGGPAGQPLSIPAAFTATSSGGAVTEMRVISRASLSCQAVDQVAALIAAAAFEPFVAQKTFSYTPPIGFSSFTVAVQYRDQASTTSAIYCATVSVEGNV